MYSFNNELCVTDRVWTKISKGSFLSHISQLIIIDKMFRVNCNKRNVYHIINTGVEGIKLIISRCFCDISPIPLLPG